MRKCDNTLKVNPMFYRNFSRYIKRESLRHLNGITYVTKKIEYYIKHSPLSAQDVKILFGFNNNDIIESIMENPLIPLRIKYKAIIENKYYKDSIIESFLRSVKSTFFSKIQKGLLLHWDKLYKKNPENFEGSLYTFDILLNTTINSSLLKLNIVKYMVTNAWVINHSSWKTKHKYSEIIQQFTLEDIINNLKILLKKDIFCKTFEHVTHTLDKIEEKKDIKSEIINYIKESIIPYVKPDYTTEIDNLLQNIIHLEEVKLLEKEDVIDMIKKIDTSQNDTLTYLIKLVKQNP